MTEHKTLIDSIIWCYQTFSIQFPHNIVHTPWVPKSHSASTQHYFAFPTLPAFLFFNLVHHIWNSPQTFQLFAGLYLLSVNFQLPSIFAKNNQRKIENMNMKIANIYGIYNLNVCIDRLGNVCKIAVHKI